VDNTIAESIRRFPQSPGVYIMKDQAGRLLYIGKAQNLKARVRSYFSQGRENRLQIPHLVRKVASLEWIATNNETEALILEANLIRKHKPDYNIDLKDDKHYPYLKITAAEHFPRLVVSRRVVDDSAEYFGPYTDAAAVRNVMDFAKKIFKLRNCSRRLPAGKPGRPCINHSIDRCSGPCGGKISEERYRENISLCIQFLKGRHATLTALLKKRMEEASASLDFESAAALRDQINLIHNASKRQRVDLKTVRSDPDVFGVYETGLKAFLCILSFRQGLLLSKRHFAFDSRLWNSDDSGREAMLLRYYQDTLFDPPSEIILPCSRGFNRPLLEAWLHRQYGKHIRLTVPQKGIKKDLLAMAEKNARLYAIQKTEDNDDAILAGLKEALHLPRIPRTIEAFDISNLGDKYSVAGMVHFCGGAPDKSLYRRFKIKSVEGQNDFAMLMEAVTRRLSRLHAEGKAFPDLLLIDGGKGQLRAALLPLDAYTNPPMVVAIAKKEETLFSPYASDPVQLPSTHPARKLIERIRDEVHRWAVSYHRNLRGKQFKRSSLEDRLGIGKKKASDLLKHFGSIHRITEASAEDIAAVKGFSLSSARKLLDQLKS